MSAPAGQSNLTPTVAAGAPIDSTMTAERRFRDILDSLFSFVGLMALDGTILDTNQAPLLAANLKPEDVIGKRAEDTYLFSHSQATRDQVRQALRRAANGETVHEIYDVRVGPDRFIRLDTVASPLRDESGKIIQIVGSGVDITDRCRAEDELRTRLRQQEAVAHLATVALHAIDLPVLMSAIVETVRRVLDDDFCTVLELQADGKSLLPRIGIGWPEGLVGSVSVGVGAESMAGYTLVSPEAVICEDMASETRFKIPSVLPEHGVVSSLCVAVKGRERPYGVIAAHSKRRRKYSREDTTFLEAVAGILAGAIERHRLEKGWQEEKALSDNLMDMLPGMVCLLDANGQFVRWSKAVERVSGYSAAEIASMDPLDFFVAEERESMRAGMHTIFAIGHNNIESRVRTKLGEFIPYYFIGVRVMTSAGPCILGIGIDITERKRLEEQLHQSQKMEAVGQLAGGIAHDFNNLLTVIIGYSHDLLSRISDGDPMREPITAINEAGERAASLTKQLLSFSRKTVMEPKVLDLNAVVNDTEKILRRLIGEDVQLTIRLHPNLRPIKVDSGQIAQVLINLAVNARDAMSSGGKLTIETRNVELDSSYAASHPEVAPGQYVLLAVTDTGCGMTPHVQRHIFEPFFTTKGVGKGTGLGMSVVHGVVKQSNGHIEVISEPAYGAAFKLYFPAIDDPVSAAVRTESHPARGGAETILLVEDEDAVRKLALFVLEEQGYRVLVARDGEDALRIVDQQHDPIDLLVTDVVMPGMDGRKLADALRKRLPKMLRLFISGYTDPALVHRGVAHDDVAFLHKPFSPTVLAKKVREVLDQKN